MLDRSSGDLAGLDFELARQIAEVCRRFEADWRAGGQPQIDSYLVDMPEEGLAGLRAELDVLERELRRSEAARTCPESGPANSSEPETTLDVSAINDASTIAPVIVPNPSLPDKVRSTVHDDATISPRNDATIDYGQVAAAEPGAPRLGRIRYFGDYELERERWPGVEWAWCTGRGSSR
jgi:hypothetical protein